MSYTDVSGKENGGKETTYRDQRRNGTQTDEKNS